MLSAESQFLGIGIYSVTDVERLTRVPADTVRRWVKGYTYKVSTGDTRATPPVWDRQLPTLEGKLALGFLDLIEVRFVNELRRREISWKTIKQAYKHAREIFRTSHPFATNRFRTDGRSIFADIAATAGEQALIDLAESQYEFRKFVDPYLHNVSFDDRDHASRWWPMGTRRRVVLDPDRSFGQPIVKQEGVPTAVLAAAFNTEGDERLVAKWYDVDPRSVRDAVEFEKSLAA